MLTKNNRRLFLYLILFLSITCINWDVIAESYPMNSSQETKPAPIIGHGTIEGIDAEKHQLIIKHDPIKTLDWPGMTMHFSVAREVDISHLKIDTTINFQLEKDRTGQIQITRIEKN